MVLIILVGLAISGFAFAISSVNQMPKDKAEAELYRSIPDWRNVGF